MRADDIERGSALPAFAAAAADSALPPAPVFVRATGPFILLILHVQSARDIKLLGRASDLIQNLARGAG